MKLAFQVALGIIIAGVVLFVGKLFFWGWFLSLVAKDMQQSTGRSVQQLNRQHQEALQSIPRYRTVTEVIKPKSIRECQTIYGQEVNETIKSCMEGSLLTVRINSKTGEREILRREKYYHLDVQNVL